MRTAFAWETEAGMAFQTFVYSDWDLVLRIFFSSVAYVVSSA